MSNRIDFVLCSKGGNGKSTVTCGIADNLVRSGEPFILVDADGTNEDSGLKFREYKDIVSVKRFDLDSKDGWALLIDELQANPDKRCLVDLPARSDSGIEENSRFFQLTFPKLNRHLVTWWVLNRQKKSIEALENYLKVLPAGPNHTVNAIVNSYWGSPEKFERFSNHKISKRFTRKDLGVSVVYPELRDSVADLLNDNEWSITKGIESSDKISVQAELEDYRNQVDATFEGLL